MIGLIGSLCSDRDSASGQAIRTTILYSKLCERYGNDNIYCVNTNDYRKEPVRVFFETIKCIFKCRQIIIMVHENGRKIFFPLLFLANKFFHRKLYHNVIGGSFAEYLAKYPNLIKYAKAFEVHWVQMESQISKLADIGLSNTELLPNTKGIRITDAENVCNYREGTFRFCMCSRITKNKGTESAIEAIEAINHSAGKKIATLDIYGISDSDYKERFDLLMKRASDAVRYCGFIPNNKTVEQLRGYFMLLFPSTYEGEGFPGTVWDAFAAGVPIIATDWRYNAEIINDRVTGLIYDYTQPQQLVEKIQYAIKNKDRIDEMRKACIAYISRYASDKVFPIIYKYFD